MEVGGLFQEVSFKVKALTLLIVEVPSVSNANNIKARLKHTLFERYGLSMEHLMQDFSMATDGSAVMATVPNASFSRDLHTPDETWMNFLAHSLNNTMKSFLQHHCVSNELQVVVDDFRSMKRIIEDANRSDWKHSLPDVFMLKQE